MREGTQDVLGSIDKSQKLLQRVIVSNYNLEVSPSLRSLQGPLLLFESSGLRGPSSFFLSSPPSFPILIAFWVPLKIPKMLSIPRSSPLRK